jgi:hypothetical protein
MAELLKAAVAANYPRIASRLLSPILELLRLSRMHCDGDMDKFLIVMVVALRTTGHHDFANCTPQQLISGELPIFPGLGTNSTSIADSLGIPRETVRRKVCELVEAGWFVRRGATLFFTASAYQELAAVREQIEQLAVDIYKAVRPIHDELTTSSAEPD